MKDASPRYDIIVIGAGSGGLNIAGFMNTAGFRVLLIDKEDRAIGGDCLNYGCVPSKALIHAAREVAQARRRGATSPIDLATIAARVANTKETIRTHENAAYFREKGMDVVLGTASFAGRDSVQVNGTVYRGKKIVIATGSRPAMTQIPGSKQVPVYTNESIFDLTQLPKSLVVIGGGPIGIELGQAFGQLGSAVTVVHSGPSILGREDAEIASVLHKRLESEGMRILTSSSISRIEAGHAIVATPEGEVRVPCDGVLLAIGRTVSFDELDLAAADIETKEGKLALNKRLQTTNSRVFACGDAAGQHQFTHAAELHAALLIRNFFSPFKRSLTTDGLAWVTYTTPEIATFGLSAEELKKRGVKFETLRDTFEHDDRAIIDGYTDCRIVLHVGRRGRILGGSLIAPAAGEMVQELILAATERIPLRAFLTKSYPYPTASRITRRLATRFYGRSLTPFAKRVLRALYG